MRSVVDVDEVFVILLNWNGARDTLACLDSLVAQERVRLRCVVVDNCSRDDSVQQIRTRFPQVHLIENKRNLGFSGGNNAGIQYALEQGARKIFILNNDTIAEPGMLHALLSHLTSQIGVVTPAIFYASEPEHVWSIGGMIHPLFLEIVKLSSRQAALPADPIERDFVTGCAILFNAEVLREVGMFDERFYPGYYEDLDLSLRIRQRGYRMLLVPKARLLHKVSQSSGGQFSPRVHYLMARNSGFYFRKHMRFWQAPFIIAFRAGSAVKTSLWLLWQRDWAGLEAYWKGLVRGWTGMLEKADRQYLGYYQ